MHDSIGRSTKPPLGATVSPTGVQFHLWAPHIKRVELLLYDGRRYPAQNQEDGYFSLHVPGLKQGCLYRYVLDGGRPFPDPASRFQPEGPHGWSEVIDPFSYAWTTGEWLLQELQLAGQVLYELHLGTFTQEGTYRAAEREFKRLRNLGITVLEIMPVHEFCGEFGWGYDGVAFFAPYHRYGRPDDLRHMVDAAHAVGLAVLLDVVYNHFGPDGNCFGEYCCDYFSKRASEWGSSPNFDNEHVREYFLQNVAAWIHEYRLDGLRFDATQAIVDSGHHEEHILAAMSRRAREAAGNRKIILVSECERQWSHQLKPLAEGGHGFDGMWNDDLHHSMMVRLTGRREAYYSDHAGSPQEFISAAKYGPLFQGQYYGWQKAPRGTDCLRLEPWQWITFLENHDQVANTLRGTRPKTQSNPGLYRAMAAYWLLTPGTPMFFMGQEYGSECPFLYFSDQKPEIHEKVRSGRLAFLKQFDSVRDAEDLAHLLSDPGSPDTFQRCKLGPDDRATEEATQYCEFFRDLLHLRRHELAVAQKGRGMIDGAVLSDGCFLLRYFFSEDTQRLDHLLLVNLGQTLKLEHIPEPLLAPPEKTHWKMIWNSERLQYGGSSVAFPITDTGWRISGPAAILLAAI
ncbi:malto-oligosyltrehalose trehalohydrolase [Terriglobus albidus]|uniref:Malto-oligosyltrehalose trehalohydrolase n=1 Tax=Terriglobus albidus TaxID=1592106 RepID=A0A5B9ECB4_9BACT|nr:malto-oligosyltrehalose trehalohydrolase [Terriglobus albidus]QEE27947.1 malto-oligosyltrehalose trehalohydrolase [Terriglobus albidus]